MPKTASPAVTRFIPPKQQPIIQIGVINRDALCFHSKNKPYGAFIDLLAPICRKKMLKPSADRPNFCRCCKVEEFVIFLFSHQPTTQTPEITMTCIFRMGRVKPGDCTYNHIFMLFSYPSKAPQQRPRTIAP